MPRGRNTLAVNTFRLRAAARERKSAMKQKNGRIGGLPANINIMNPVPNKDAKSITGLVRKNGKVSGYELSDGRVLSKREGVAWPSKGARGVAIASLQRQRVPALPPDGDGLEQPGGPALLQPGINAKSPGQFPSQGIFQLFRKYQPKRDDHSAIFFRRSYFSTAYFSALANSFSARSGKERVKLL